MSFPKGLEASPIEQNPESDTTWTALHNFATKYTTGKLQNALINNLLEQSDNNDYQVPWYQAVTLAFRGLPRSSPLLMLFVELYTYEFTGEVPEEECDNTKHLPARFTHQVMVLMGKIR